MQPELTRPVPQAIQARCASRDARQPPRSSVSTTNGGLFERPKEAPNPTVYVGVQSVDTSVKKVEAAGGKVITAKTPIPGMGAFARVADTEGNVIGLFEGAQ